MSWTGTIADLDAGSQVPKFGTTSNDVSVVHHLEMGNGDIITGCTEFRYLGTMFNKDGRDSKNMRHRVT